MIQAVVFDMDDTLYPEKEFVFGGFKAVSDHIYKKLGFNIYHELKTRFEAEQRGDLFTPVLKTYLETVEEDFVKQLVEIYRQHEPVLQPFSEVREVLEKLKNHYKLAIISDGIFSVQNRKLQSLKISHFFDSIIFSDEWGKNFWKPNPFPYQECMRRLSLDSSSIVYIGDNPNKDFITAREIGMMTIRIRRIGTLYYNLRLLPKQEADHEVSNLNQIFALLK